jgi:hypothetical protein
MPYARLESRIMEVPLFVASTKTLTRCNKTSSAPPEAKDASIGPTAPLRTCIFLRQRGIISVSSHPPIFTAFCFSCIGHVGAEMEPGMHVDEPDSHQSSLPAPSGEGSPRHHHERLPLHLTSSSSEHAMLDKIDPADLVGIYEQDVLCGRGKLSFNHRMY